MKLLALVAPSLAGVTYASICLIMSLIFLGIAAFISEGSTPPAPPARWYPRIRWAWVGTFFYVLSVALS